MTQLGEGFGVAGGPPLRAAVVLFAFNRPETTARVFAAIRAARPSRLLLVCDGPRADRAGEAERCAEVRRIVGAVDWPCEVERNFSDVNLGCRVRISSGIDWVFARTDEAIFLEDDTLPDATFFRYCDELLARYRDDARVMMISGYNALGDSRATVESYWFSAVSRIWGWASWRRAWSGYDVQMTAWPAFRLSPAWQKLSAEEREVCGPWLDAVHAGLQDTWDAQLLLLAWQKEALTVIPRRNLIENLGFGADSTHTPAVPALYPSRTWPMEFPLTPAATARRDRARDLDWLRREHGLRGTAAGRAMRRHLRDAARWLRMVLLRASPRRPVAR